MALLCSGRVIHAARGYLWRVTRPVTHRPQLATNIAIHPRSSSTLTPTRRSFKAAISNINGIGGKAAWAWIFISEGFATVVAGVLSFWIIVDFPDDATSLSTRSSSGDFRENDQFSVAGERPKWENIVASRTDRKTYVSLQRVRSRTRMIDVLG